MIGWFTISDKRDGHTYCIASSDAVDGVKGRFYIPPLYRSSVAELSNGQRVFGVLDDASGFGAVLFKEDDQISKDNELSVAHDLAVGGKATISGDLTVQGSQTTQGNATISGFLSATGAISTQATISGNSPNTTINLTAAHAALIFAAALSGTAAPLAATPVIMQNGG